MTEKEYMDELERLRKAVRSGKARQVMKAIDGLFEFKPVRLKWHVLKAEALAALGQWEEGARLLRDRYRPDAPDAEADNYWAWHRRYCRERKDAPGADAYRHLQQMMRCSAGEDPDPFLLQLEGERVEQERAFLEAPGDPARCGALADAYFRTNRTIEAHVLWECERKLRPEESGRQREPLLPCWETNMEYLQESLRQDPAGFFAVAAGDEDNLQTALVLCTALREMGHTVTLLTGPVECEVEGTLRPEDTLEISLGSRERLEGFDALRPVRLVRGEERADNVASLLDFLSRETPRDLVHVLAPAWALDGAFEAPVLRKRSERLSAYPGDALADAFSFGYAGDNLSYLSDVYREDVRAQLDAPAACAFSIILPVRNSAGTLRATLRTCMDQRFDDYEIVLMDNSTGGNTAVRDLARELSGEPDGEKIRYLRPPRPLSLSRNFEYAFLKARGELLISLGADDGMLPWGLEAVHEVMKNLPDEELLLFDRGFYVWPGFENAPQIGQFVIPAPYRKGNLQVRKLPCAALLSQVLRQPEMMYSMPLLYHNSACRRRYLRTLVEKTGRLWAGMSQDLYMGVVSLALHESIYQLAYPITVAGMSGASIGAASVSKGKSGQRDEDGSSMDASSPGSYVPTALERWTPFSKADRFVLYSSVLRAVAFGVLGEELLREFGWKQMYELLLSQLSGMKSRQDFDRIAGELRHQAGRMAPALLEALTPAFDELMTPITVRPLPEGYKVYEEGFTGNGGLMLDARRFGVSDVEQAVRLFASIANL